MNSRRAAQLARFQLLLVLFPMLFLTGCVGIGLGSVSTLLEPEPVEPEATPGAQLPTQIEVMLVEPSPESEATTEDAAAPILFISDRGGEGTTDIYQINADGSGLVRLTDGPGNDRDPRRSPDRQSIAFASDRSGISQIYILTMGDYSVVQLTDHPHGAVSPTWSPDGSQIAFVEPTPDSNTLFIVASVAGSEITRVPIDAVDVASPAWAPRGDVIAFSARAAAPTDSRDIYSLKLGDDRLNNLTNHPGNDDNPAWAPNAERLAFQTNRDGNNDIYVMHADGSRQTPLTIDPASDVEPDWSPNGHLITFGSNRNGAFDVYVMSESGADQRALAQFPADDLQPRWPPPPAPSSEELAFAAGDATGFWDLYAVELAGGSVLQLTDNQSVDITMPDWSPDGAQILYAANQEGQYDIYAINVDSSGEPIRLTEHPGPDMHPSWSPDGTQIAFESKRDGSDWDVWVMNADGSDLRNLTPGAQTNEGNPAWSPDGQQLAFSSDRDGDYDIYVMNIDDSGEPIKLTNLRGDDFRPAWSPDGTLIAFRSTLATTGKRQIYVMRSDGRVVRPLFTSEANDDSPDWSPDGQQIAFASDREHPGRDKAGTNAIYVYHLVTRTIEAVTQGDQEAQYPDWRPQKVRANLETRD